MGQSVRAVTEDFIVGPGVAIGDHFEAVPDALHDILATPCFPIEVGLEIQPELRGCVEVAQFVVDMRDG